MNAQVIGSNLEIDFFNVIQMVISTTNTTFVNEESHGENGYSGSISRYSTMWYKVLKYLFVIYI